MGGLTDKQILVTGGLSGIGHAVVAELQKAGARPIVVDRADVAPPGRMRYEACDLSDESEVAALCARLPDQLDGLVNVAGASGATGPMVAFTVNYLAPRRLIDELLPRFRDGGSVVTVASTAGANWRRHIDLLRELVARDDWSSATLWFESQAMDGTRAYDFSKEAIVYYSQWAATRRFRDSGVRVNTVSPGPVSTPLLAEFRRTMGAESLDRIQAVTGRDGRPDEVAHVAMFLLSDQASWVNGTDVHVDGGAESAFNTGIIGTSRTGAAAH